MKAASVPCHMTFQCKTATSSVTEVLLWTMPSLEANSSCTNDLFTDLESLKVGLNNLLTRQDRETRIIINGVRYFVSPVPCGLTVAHLDSPHCFNDTLGTENKTVMPTTHAATGCCFHLEPSSRPHCSHHFVAVMCVTM